MDLFLVFTLNVIFILYFIRKNSICDKIIYKTILIIHSQ